MYSFIKSPNVGGNAGRTRLILVNMTTNGEIQTLADYGEDKNTKDESDYQQGFLQQHQFVELIRERKILDVILD